MASSSNLLTDIALITTAVLSLSQAIRAVHEVALASDELLASSEQFRRIVAHHTTPEEAGIVFAEVAPKLAVYTHLVMLSSRTIPEAPLHSLITRTRTNYDGPLVIGEDLMSFIVDDTVSVLRAAR
jgi:ribonuclease Z